MSRPLHCSRRIRDWKYTRAPQRLEGDGLPGPPLSSGGGSSDETVSSPQRRLYRDGWSADGCSRFHAEVAISDCLEGRNSADECCFFPLWIGDKCPRTRLLVLRSMSTAACGPNRHVRHIIARTGVRVRYHKSWISFWGWNGRGHLGENCLFASVLASFESLAIASTSSWVGSYVPVLFSTRLFMSSAILYFLAITFSIFIMLVLLSLLNLLLQFPTFVVRIHWNVLLSLSSHLITLK